MSRPNTENRNSNSVIARPRLSAWQGDCESRSKKKVEADDPARNRCGCFLPDLTRLATAPSADFRAGIWAMRQTSTQVHALARPSFICVHPARRLVAVVKGDTPNAALPLLILARRRAPPRRQPPPCPRSQSPSPDARGGRLSSARWASRSGRMAAATTRSPTGSTRPTTTMTAYLTVDEMQADAERFFACSTSIMTARSIPTRSTRLRGPWSHPRSRSGPNYAMELAAGSSDECAAAVADIMADRWRRPWPRWRGGGNGHHYRARGGADDALPGCRPLWAARSSRSR